MTVTSPLRAMIAKEGLFGPVLRTAIPVLLDAVDVLDDYPTHATTVDGEGFPPEHCQSCAQRARTNEVLTRLRDILDARQRQNAGQPSIDVNFTAPSRYTRCRRSHCLNFPVADLYRKYTKRKGGELWAYCAKHLAGYNREVREDGFVWWRGAEVVPVIRERRPKRHVL